MRIALYVFLILLGQAAHAQAWTNLDLDENKEGLELNPLKGFSDLYGPENNFPRSINGKLIGLDEVMTGFDTYDWSVVDAFIDQNKSEGNYTYLQVNIDPGFGGSYMPEFLTQIDCANDDSAGGPLDGNYCAYNFTSGLPDLVPDWNDEDIVSAMERFIVAFGIEYNNRPEVFMVHLGLYGIFGEWQIGSAINEVPGFEMTPANRARVANAFRDAFPDTLLMARYPEHMPDPEIYGYSDGLFFTQSISEDTFFNNGYFNNTIKAYNADNNWRLRVIGGEIDPCVQPFMWQTWPNPSTAICPDGSTANIQDAEDSLRATHTSFLFTHHVFQNGVGPAEGSDEWNNALRAQKLMGYTYHVGEYRLSAANGSPAIEVRINNIGIAPMYANWDIEFAALDSNGQFIPLGSKKWNLNLIQPDTQSSYRSFVSDALLDDGSYTIMMKVTNPLEPNSAAAQPVRFANTTQDVDRMGWLTLGAASITAGSLGVTPTRVSSVSVAQTMVTMVVGDNLQLTATVSPSDATDQSVTWVSDHPGTAFVDANGFVSAGPSYGTAKVYAYSNDVGANASTPFAVVNLTVEPNRVAIPAVIEAEDYIRMSGVVRGSNKVGYIDNTDWIDYGVIVDTPANFLLDIFAGCPMENQDDPCAGVISVKDQDGDTLDVIALTTTDSFDDFEVTTSNAISLPEGAFNIRLEATVGKFDLDKIEFRVDGFADADTDGVPDATDNCIDDSNADQRDTNGDGFGNACDPDLNNDLQINVLDLGLLRSVFFTADPDADFNGDGAVNVLDLGVMRSRFFGAPGPSGIAQ